MATFALKDAKTDAVRRTGIVLICLVSFIWALMEIVIQHIPGGYSLYQVVWVRYATHLLFMLVILAPRHARKLITTRHPGLQILRALMMLIMPVSFILASGYIKIGTILTVFWLSPLIIIVLSMVLLRENVSWHYWLFSIVGFIYAATLYNPRGATMTTGIMLSLAMGLSFSLYVVMTRMLREESTSANLFYTALGVFVPLSFWLPAFWKALTFQSGLMMVLVGLLGFILLWVLDRASDMTSSAALAPFLFTQVLWMAVLHLIIKIL
ncbi:MAG: DMT family transporter [Anaerolineales bacterium]